MHQHPVLKPDAARLLMTRGPGDIKLQTTQLSIQQRLYVTGVSMIAIQGSGSLFTNVVDFYSLIQLNRSIWRPPLNGCVMVCGPNFRSLVRYLFKYFKIGLDSSSPTLT